MNGGPFSAVAWVFASLALASLVGYSSARIVAPRLSPRSADDLGRLWAARCIFWLSISQLTLFFSGLDPKHLVGWLLITCMGAPLAFLAGRSRGKSGGLPVANASLGAETALDENNIEGTSPLLSGPANDQSRYAAILYKEFIGNKATDYYLNEFVRLTRLESGRRSAPSVFSFIPSAHNYLARTWNTPSFIFSYAWALYRKLYGWSAALFLVSFVFFMAIREGSRSLGVIGLITASSAFGMYANALYYKKAKATINNARELSDSEEQTIAKVKDKGGVSDWALLAGVGHVLLGVPALLIALAAPQPSIDLASTSESASTSPADGRVYPVAPGKDHPASDSALATAVPDVVDSDRHIRDLYSARRFSELVQFAQQRLIEYPNDTLAANYAGLACVEMRNPVEARLWFQRAVELSPESPTLYYNLASTYNLQTDYRKIIEILTAAHQINPDNASVNDALISAQRFAQQIQAERAAQAPIRAIQPSPKTQAVDDYDCEVKPVMTDEEIRRWRKCSQ